MAGIKGKTGNPGTPNPKKKNSTSFAVAGVEPKGRMMGFRPRQSLEQQIDDAVAASGLKLADWLEKAAIAYLEKSPQAGGKELEQEQLNSACGSAEDAIATVPTLGTRNGGEDQSGDTTANGKSKGGSKRGAGTGETTRTGRRRKQTSEAD